MPDDLKKLYDKLKPLMRYLPRNGRYHQKKVVDDYLHAQCESEKDEIEQLFNAYEKGETVSWRE